MAYKPTEWKTGDVVTSSKLNNIEKALECLGVAMTDIVFHLTETVTYDEETGDETVTYDSDKTFAEVYEAINQDMYVTMVYKKIYVEGEYSYVNELMTFVAPNGYGGGWSENSIPFVSKPLTMTDESLGRDWFVPQIKGTLITGTYYNDGSFQIDNYLETRASNGIKIPVTQNGNEYTLEATAQDLWGMINDGNTLYLQFPSSSKGHESMVCGFSYTVGVPETDFEFTAFDPVLGEIAFTASTGEDYPVYTAS